jgi:hypothetical protein
VLGTRLHELEFPNIKEKFYPLDRDIQLPLSWDISAKYFNNFYRNYEEEY